MQAQHQPLVVDHRLAVLLPVRVRPAQPLVDLDQLLDRVVVGVIATDVSSAVHSATVQAHPAGVLTYRLARGSRRRFVVFARPSVTEILMRCLAGS